MGKNQKHPATALLLSLRLFFRHQKEKFNLPPHAVSPVWLSVVDGLAQAGGDKWTHTVKLTANQPSEPRLDHNGRKH